MTTRGIRMDHLPGVSVPTVDSIGYLSTSGPDRNPPRVVLGGNMRIEYVDIKISVHDEGYPGGIDLNGVFHPTQVASVDWTITYIDGRISRKGPLPLDRADNPGVFGPSKKDLEDSGLTAYFTPGLYRNNTV